MFRLLCVALPAVVAGCAAGGMSLSEAPAPMEAYATGGEATADSAPEAVSPASAPGDGGGGIAAGAAGEAGEGAAGSGPLAAIVVRRGGEGDNEGPDAITRDAPRPLLIYTATIGMSVDEDEIVATIDRIIEEAVRLGGYLATRADRSVQVRIPSANFREGLASFEQLGDITSRSVNAEDVTEEYHDAEVRLQNLRAIRDRLEQFLSRAQNIEEVLRVHTELERVSREIDGIEGRLRFLRARVAFSLVSVSLSARPPVVVASEPTGPATPPPPPPPVRPDIPVEWLGEMSIDRLMTLREED